MPPKTDPYATKLHRRVDLVLLVLIIALVAILLRSSAHGQATKIRSEWEQDWLSKDWRGERTALFYPTYHLILQPALIAASQAVLLPTDATAVLWSSSGGSAWLTGSNWTGGSVPTGTQIAEFGVNPTSGATGVGINMNGSTNNGANNQAVGAIYVDSNRTAALIIGNSSATANGTLTLSGVTVNSINNVVLRNNSSQLLTIRDTQGSGNKLMDLALGNATDNIINLDSTGGVVISSIIKDATGNHLTLAGAGSGTLTLSGANTYTGGTTVNSATLKLSGSGTLGSTSGSLTVNGGTIDLNGTNQTVGALSGGTSGLIRNTSSTTPSTLVVGNGGGSGTYNGQIALNVGTTLHLIKSGGGTETLTNNNSYTGTTTINGGTLELANASGVALSGTSSVTVNNAGTLLFSQNDQINQATFPGITLNGGEIDAGGKSQGTGGMSTITPGNVGLGALTLTSNSTIDLSSISVLHFANSNGNAWTGTLSILNWNGTATTGGGSEQILFGTNVTGLTTMQLTQVQFIDPAGFIPGTYGAIWALDGTGEIVPTLAPIPEPSTWIAAALAMGALGWTQLRRFRFKKLTAEI